MNSSLPVSGARELHLFGLCPDSRAWIGDEDLNSLLPVSGGRIDFRISMLELMDDWIETGAINPLFVIFVVNTK